MGTERSSALHPLFAALDSLGLSLESVVADQGLNSDIIREVTGGGNPNQLDWLKLRRELHRHGLLFAGSQIAGATGQVSPGAGFNDFRHQERLFETDKGPCHVLIVGTLDVSDLRLLNDLKAGGHLAYVACDSFPVRGSGNS
jgi:hypothetical protein